MNVYTHSVHMRAEFDWDYDREVLIRLPDGTLTPLADYDCVEVVDVSAPGEPPKYAESSSEHDGAPRIEVVVLEAADPQPSLLNIEDRT